MTLQATSRTLYMYKCVRTARNFEHRHHLSFFIHKLTSDIMRLQRDEMIYNKPQFKSVSTANQKQNSKFSTYKGIGFSNTNLASLSNLLPQIVHSNIIHVDSIRRLNLLAGNVEYQ